MPLTATQRRHLSRVLNPRILSVVGRYLSPSLCDPTLPHVWQLWHLSRLDDVALDVLSHGHWLQRYAPLDGRALCSLGHY